MPLTRVDDLLLRSGCALKRLSASLVRIFKVAREHFIDDVV